MLSTVPPPAVYAENSDSGVSVMQSRMAKILDRIFGAQVVVKVRVFRTAYNIWRIWTRKDNV